MNKQSIHYKTRDIGYGIEEDWVDAYVTADVDCWGKRTIIIDSGNGKLERLYLFADEYEVEGN